MAFIETPRFPDGIARGSAFGPAYSTSVARNLGGYEVRNQNRSMPLYEGDLVHNVKTQAQLDDLLNFFHGVAGMQNGFRFKSWADFAAAGSQGTLVAIDATHWQMYKTYTYGALTMSRKISKPLAGAAIAGGGTYAYDTVTGIITKSAGANPTGWSGEFDFPVRFNLDQFLPLWINIRLFNIPSIPIVEIRL